MVFNLFIKVMELHLYRYPIYIDNSKKQVVVLLIKGGKKKKTEVIDYLYVFDNISFASIYYIFRVGLDFILKKKNF